jgi:hypothetical protein
VRAIPLVLRFISSDRDLAGLHRALSATGKPLTLGSQLFLIPDTRARTARRTQARRRRIWVCALPSGLVQLPFEEIAGAGHRS